ncbi:MAG: response regulator transcription factor [Dehalococcoidia bacterium]|nr:response regulator transcription factor [Dehalococcoidia bacterium]
MARHTILLVEDEETLSRALSYSLEREGHRVLTAADGELGLALARSQRPDLVILDLMLPKLDGLQVCRALRAESSIPILMLTARADEVDKIVGLQLGADDYVTKPFSMRELLARVAAILRRADLGHAAPTSHAGPVLVADGLEVSIPARQAKLHGARLALRPKEFDLLAFLLQNRGAVFSRSALLERVWGYDYAGDTRTVDVHIHWLREKIEANPAKPARLITSRGAGYKFEASA